MNYAALGALGITAAQRAAGEFSPYSIEDQGGDNVIPPGSMGPQRPTQTALPAPVPSPMPAPLPAPSPAPTSGGYSGSLPYNGAPRFLPSPTAPAAPTYAAPAPAPTAPQSVPPITVPQSIAQTENTVPGVYTAAAVPIQAPTGGTAAPQPTHAAQGGGITLAQLAALASIAALLLN